MQPLLNFFVQCNLFTNAPGDTWALSAVVVLHWNISALQLEPHIDMAKNKKAMALSWIFKPHCFKGHFKEK